MAVKPINFARSFTCPPSRRQKPRQLLPPFQLSAICFAIGSIPGLVVIALNPSRLALLKQPVKVWITGIAGLFGYHFLYFPALRNAPA
ncbi:hypothetical protein ACC674_37455, partial [Rhizobium ruizarguesonis]